MERETIGQWVLQYLQETGCESALKAAQEELCLDYNYRLEKESMLVRALDEHRMWQLERELAGVELEPELDAVLGTSGHGRITHEHVGTLAHLHRKNIIASCFSTDGQYLATGSSDKLLSISTPKEGKWSELEQTVAAQFQLHTAGILDLDWNPSNPSLLLSSSMDWSHAVVDMDRILSELSASTNSEQPHAVIPVQCGAESVQMFKDHRKFVNRARWSPNGRNFVTCSHDGTVNVYGLKEGDVTSFELRHQINFGDRAVEGLSFVDDDTCVVAKRDDHQLYYININTKQITPINMNLKRDSHVSFSTLDLVSSRSKQYVVAVTDRSRSIMFESRSPKQVRNFYGAENDGYAVPSACFDTADEYLYGTSQQGPSVVCWDIGMERMVHTINPHPNGHKQAIRSLRYHPTEDIMASCGFDKTVRLWQPGL